MFSHASTSSAVKVHVYGYALSTELIFAYRNVTLHSLSIRVPENSDHLTVLELRKLKLYPAPLFTDIARGYLSIPASSASAERLFGDAGYQQGARRQHETSSVTEMLLMIRSYVKARIADHQAQNGILSGRADSVRFLAEQIAKSIHEKDNTRL